MASESVTPMDEQTTEESGTGLENNVMAALAYVLGILTGIVVYLIEQDDEFVRFHAAQSIAVFGILFVASIVLSFVGTIASVLFFSGSTGGFIAGSLISLLLGLLWFVLGVGGFVLWVYLIVRAYQGNTPRIPIAAGLADRLV